MGTAFEPSRINASAAVFALSYLESSALTWLWMSGYPRKSLPVYDEKKGVS